MSARPTPLLLTPLLALTLGLTACATTTVTTPATLVSLAPQTACASLVGLSIPASSIGLPTSGASVVAANDTTDTDPAGQTRSYCKVTGNILPVDASAPNIRFEVNLPPVWNVRAVQFGGGGTDGSVVTGLDNFAGAPKGLATPLARGYVTLGSDSGHDATGKPPFDTSFALNQESLTNFAGAQVKKTVDVAKSLTVTFYGRKPAHTYFIGGSQGGHEALDAAQRYPDDYSGVVAEFPAYNLMNMWLGAWAQARAIYGNQLGVPSAAWSSPAKIATLVSYVQTQCDGLDGVQDGLISNVKACNAVVTPDTVKAALRCPDGTDTGNTCFSDAQLAEVTRIASPVDFGFAFADGSTGYPRWPILEGATFLQNHLGRTNTADLSKYPFAADGSAFQLFPAKGDIQGFVTQNLSADPLAFEPSQWVSRIQQLSPLTDAVSTDYSRFTAHGGKMLLMHGTVDDSISPYNTIKYWDRLVAANGASTVASFAKFYVIPGMGHGSGAFTASFDYLGALQSWVEGGKAPQNPVASDDNSAAATSATNNRTRPLCEYGSYPKYTGAASPTQAQMNDAANFTCTAY